MDGVLSFAAHGLAASTLAWWLEAGVDAPVGDARHDWLALAAPEPPAATASAAPPHIAAPTARQGPDTSATKGAAEAAARAAPDAGALADAFRTLAGPGARLFTGDPASAVLLLVEAPDAQGTASGDLIGGESARLLDAMLSAIGRARETVCLAALAPHPAPSAADYDMTLPFIRRLADLVAPRAVVAMGGDAAALLLGARRGVGRMRGTFLEWNGHPLMPTFRPALLLAQPAQKAAAWADMRKLKAQLAR